MLIDSPNCEEDNTVEKGRCTMETEDIEFITNTLTVEFPELQALYLFGSAALQEAGSIEDVCSPGDIDIALLFPVETAQKKGPLSMTDAAVELEEYFSLPVDLVNIRNVSLSFRKEILATGRRVYSKDTKEADTFEMLTISFYQKLNEERREILEDFFKTRRAYNV